MKELKMSKERFFSVLTGILERYKHIIIREEDFLKEIEKHWGTLEEYALSMYDDFYEILQKK